MPESLPFSRAPVVDDVAAAEDADVQRLAAEDNDATDPAAVSIDRHSYEPAYAQLARILRRHISAGLFRPGDRLPSEAQLCKRYGVSPMTVRRVIKGLSEQGVVVTAQGRGTFVKSLEFADAAFRLDGLQRLFQDERRTRVKILQARITSADEHIARQLNTSVGQRVICIHRVILSEDEPLLLHHEYLRYDPTRPIVEAEMEVTSLQGLFQRVDRSAMKRGNLTIAAAVLTEEDARVLKQPVGDPAFRVEHVFFDFDNQPVSWGWFICPGNHFSFTAVVGV